VSDPARRVQQLLALATDPAATEEEARTAALQAARGIKAHGLQVTTSYGHEPAPQRSYGTTVTPQGRQMGPGTSRLPQRPPQRAPRGALAAGPQDETGYGRSGSAYAVDLDFKDDVPGQKAEPAFSAALLALLRR